jgi:hypothetical protein
MLNKDCCSPIAKISRDIFEIRMICLEKKCYSWSPSPYQGSVGGLRHWDGAALDNTENSPVGKEPWEKAALCVLTGWVQILDFNKLYFCFSLSDGLAGSFWIFLFFLFIIILLLYLGYTVTFSKVLAIYVN